MRCYETRPSWIQSVMTKCNPYQNPLPFIILTQLEEIIPVLSCLEWLKSAALEATLLYTSLNCSWCLIFSIAYSPVFWANQTINKMRDLQLAEDLCAACLNWDNHPTCPMIPAGGFFIDFSIEYVYQCIVIVLSPSSSYLPDGDTYIFDVIICVFRTGDLST